MSVPLPLRRDPFFWSLVALGVVQLAWLAAKLTGSSLLAYPWIDGDSWDWVLNGLWFAGEDVRFSGRSPLLPLLIAALDRFGLSLALPLLLQSIFRATVVVFYASARRSSGRGPALVAALVVSLGFSFQTLALDLMADVPAACLLFLACAVSFRAEEHPRLWMFAGLIAGLATSTQQIALLWTPAVLGASLLAKKTVDRFLASGVLICLAFPLSWALWKLVHFGTAGDLLVRQWGLVHFHLDAVPHYAWSFASLFGLPAALLACGGLGWTAQRCFSSREKSLTCLLFFGVAAFFVLFYDFTAKRFLIYLAWPAALFLAEAFAGVSNRALRAGLAVLAISCAAMPLPESGRDPRSLALWPLPPMLAYAGLASGPAGSARATPESATLARARVADLAEWQERAYPSPPLLEKHANPTKVAASREVVYLFTPQEVANRYETMTRLGVAWRRKVKFLPFDLFAPHLNRFKISPQGRSSLGVSLYQVASRGTTKPWLLAVRTESVADFALLESSEQETSNPPHPIALRRAKQILARLSGSTTYLALGILEQTSDLTPLWVAVEAPTTEVYVFLPENAEAARREFDRASGAESEFGPAWIKRSEVFGRPSGWVLFGLDQ